MSEESRVQRWGLVLVLAILMKATPAVRSTLNPGLPAHDVHVTLTRMAVDSAAIVSRVRLFKDDLQAGLIKFHKLQKLDLTTGKDNDSLFAVYLAERVWLEADGVRLMGTVQASGIEADEQGQPMIWFIVEYPVSKPPKTLGVRNDLLFEMFPSQQNIVNLLNVADEKRYSLYFVPGNTKVQEVALQ